MRKPTLLLCVAASFGSLDACVGDSSPTDGGADVTLDSPVTETGTDATKEAGDAAPDAPVAACNLSKPFDPPQPLANITTSANHEDGIWLTPDQLNAYVSATRPDSGSFDIFTTSRASVDASFGGLVPLPGSLNTTQDERTPISSADNLTLYYYYNADATHMYAATRTSVSSAFGAGQAVAPPLSSATPAEGVSWISPDGLTIYIGSSRGDGVNEHIFVATRASTSVPFGTPTPTGMPNSSAREGSAVLTGDQLTMYYVSTQNVAGGEVWKATRSTTSDGFGSTAVVPELSGTAYNAPSWVSPDGCTIYVVHRSPDAGNTYDLVVASKPAI